MRNMNKSDPRIDAYILKSESFAQPILEHFRKLVNTTCPEVTETIKWGFPHFMYRDAILCSMAGFKKHCTIMFWKAPLFKDTLLKNNKREEGMGHFGKITGIKDLPKDKILINFIKEGMKLNESGIKLPKSPKIIKPELEIPEAFQKALKQNKKASQAFKNFSPSHRREYILWITEAKTVGTRDKRIASALEWLFEGKSRNWQYEKK